MDRKIVYPGAIPLDTDPLDAQKAALVALAWLSRGTIGAEIAADGLACTPTIPASMQVQVQPGQVFALAPTDGTAYGSILPDTVRTLVKQGLSHDVTNLTVTAPTTSGHSQIYIVQVGFAETDDTPVVLPYYNAANPAVAYSGPNGTGASQNTWRRGRCVIQVVAGVSAPSGTQVSPAPSPGFTALYAITVANGQTTVTSGNIAVLPSAPFIPTKLPLVPGDVRSAKWISADDTGATNALAVTLAPAAAAYTKFMSLQVKVAATNTGSVTINVNGLGPKSINRADGSTLRANDLIVGAIARIVYDGVSFQLQNVTGSSVPFRNQQSFISNGTFTVPAGIYFLGLRIWGAGGGGGGSNGAGSAASGGAAGGYTEGVLAVTPGQVIPVTVNLGGLGGPGGAGVGNGGAGATSSFGSLASATGGAGGGGFSGAGVNTTSAAGGVGAGGTLNMQGGSGGFGFSNATAGMVAGGIGGGAPFGGPPPGQAINSVGQGGYFPGGGGQGGSIGNAGGPGANGFVIVTW